MAKAQVVGVGMVPFATPRTARPYDEMANAAVTAALSDAKINFGQVQQAYGGYVYGDSTSGQRALYQVGQTGIPVINVNNNCSTGSTVLWLARQAVESGAADCVLAFGFEQMQRGALKEHWEDRPGPLEISSIWRGGTSRLRTRGRLRGADGRPLFRRCRADYMERYGIGPEVFAAISVKARKHAANNPYAVFRDQVSVQDVLDSPHVYGPLTRLQCCPPTCGAAAAVVTSERFARTHDLDTTVRIAAQAMTTDTATSFTTDMINLVGYGLTTAAAGQVYEAAGIGPEDVTVVELHDCFTTNELLSYEALGLTPEGTAEKFIADGDNTYGGRVVTNPSGGLLSKGHPLGATGLAQCAELVWQLRGQAGARQVPDPKIALQHNIGLGGAAVVTLYERTA